MEDENHLKASLKKGNELAYQQLYQQHYYYLVAYAFKHVGSMDGAREVVQQVITNLYERRNSLEIKGNLKAYLTRSVFNESLRFVRKDQNLLELDPYEIGEETDHLEVAESEARIWSAINELPPRCKEILLMNRIEGMTNEEIAQKMDLSKRTIETQITKALKSLRDTLFSIFF